MPDITFNRYDKDSTQILRDGVVVGMINTMADDTYRPYWTDDRPIIRANFTSLKKAKDWVMKNAARFA